MSLMTMSLPALYNYALSVDGIDIFSGLNLPTGLTKQTLVDNILIHAAEFETVYSNPEYLQAAIGTWSDTHYRTFEKWVNALSIDYDPLYNYDRTEESTENILGSEQRKSTRANEGSTTEGNDTKTGRSDKSNSSSVGSTSSKTDTSNTDTNTVSAFDSGSWSNADKTDSTGATTTLNNDVQGVQTVGDSNESSTNLRAELHKDTDNATDSKDNVETRTNKLRAYGNIGTVSSQKMLGDELEISAWNIYEHITDLFLDEFCVMLY